MYQSPHPLIRYIEVNNIFQFEVYKRRYPLSRKTWVHYIATEDYAIGLFLCQFKLQLLS
jgi:hypothetical protein